MTRLIDILYLLCIKEFKVRYKGTFLGYFWALGTPLLLGLIFTFVFKHVMRIQVQNYTLFLLIGLFSWQFFSNSTNACLMSYISNEQLIKKLCFQRYLLPLSTAIIEGAHFVLGIPILLIFFFFYGKPIFHTAWLYQIPLFWLTQLCLCYSTGLIVSSINTFFRDIERITSLGLTLAMYLTPIAYPISMVPEKYRFFYNLNPMADLIENWRSIFLNGQIKI